MLCIQEHRISLSILSNKIILWHISDIRSPGNIEFTGLITQEFGSKHFHFHLKSGIRLENMEEINHGV